MDSLTYAGNLDNLKEIEHKSNYKFIQEDICNHIKLKEILKKEKINSIIHLAAESHVDRSITNPMEFIMTNVVGTVNLLNAAKNLWNGNEAGKLFYHVSTDEVYGSLGSEGLFTEDTPYDPNSPYSASKASSDHLVRAWHTTFGLPTIVTNCSNNYGPFHFPEKLIPVVILNALAGKPLPIYRDGGNIRDWLYVVVSSVPT